MESLGGAPSRQPGQRGEGWGTGSLKKPGLPIRPAPRLAPAGLAFPSVSLKPADRLPSHGGRLAWPATGTPGKPPARGLEFDFQARPTVPPSAQMLLEGREATPYRSPYRPPYSPIAGTAAIARQGATVPILEVVFCSGFRGAPRAAHTSTTPRLPVTGQSRPRQVRLGGLESGVQARHDLPRSHNGLEWRRRRERPQPALASASRRSAIPSTMAGKVTGRAPGENPPARDSNPSPLPADRTPKASRFPPKIPIT